MRQRLTVLFASLALAVGGLAVTAGPASAESYGYINWTNNCGSPWLYGIIYASGGKSGTSVVQETNVPAGATRAARSAGASRAPSRPSRLTGCSRGCPFPPT